MVRRCLSFTLLICVYTLAETKGKKYIPVYKPSCHGPGNLTNFGSPIDISSKETVRRCMEPLKFSANHWFLTEKYYVRNTGSYPEFLLSDHSRSLTLSGGPLCGTYVFYGFHFHWSSANNNGTEHSVNEKKFAMEAHVVYYNSKYDDLQSALKYADGAAVLGFFIETRWLGWNRRFRDLTRGLEDVTREGEEKQLGYRSLATFRRTALSGKYFYYEGSLTRYRGEPASWILFTPKISISARQVEPFRRLETVEGSPLSNIYPLQPLDGRTVYEAVCTAY